MQYDILGIDLDDDEVVQNGNDSVEDENGEGRTEPQTTSQGIVQEIASLALTSVLQLGFRTGTFKRLINLSLNKVFLSLYHIIILKWHVYSLHFSSYEQNYCQFFKSSQPF